MNSSNDCTRPCARRTGLTERRAYSRRNNSNTTAARANGSAASFLGMTDPVFAQVKALNLAQYARASETLGEGQ